MKLLTELTEDIEFLKEDKNGSKGYFISGPFMVAETTNGNGRIYPQSILERELENFQSTINEKRALGELGHPSNPTMNLDRASHLITELKMTGNIAHGKAKILDTPMGKIAKNFLDEGIKLGVSTRGVGSLKESNGQKIVQPDFRLMTIDIVSTPSGPGCYVESIMENVDWFFDGMEWQKKEQIVESFNHAKTIKDKAEREQMFLEAFTKFMKNL